MDWKIEKRGNNYHVLGYDDDDLVTLDRDVDNFLDACILVDEVRNLTKNQIVEQVNQYDTAFWLQNK